jgi:hypothetical protein
MRCRASLHTGDRRPPVATIDDIGTIPFPIETGTDTPGPALELLEWLFHLAGIDATVISRADRVFPAAGPRRRRPGATGLRGQRLPTKLLYETRGWKTVAIEEEFNRARRSPRFH